MYYLHLFWSKAWVALLCLISLTGYAQPLPSSITFYAEEEPILVSLNGKPLNDQPQTEVTLHDAPTGNHEVTIRFADTTMRPIEQYAMSFPQGYDTRYKIKRKSIPYERPRFYLQFFEQQPLVYTIQIEATGIRAGEPLQLYAIRGDELPLLAEVKYDNNAVFVLPDTTSAGMLRLRFGQKEELDFIFNQEHIRFSFDRKQPFETLAFQQSFENQLYFDQVRASNRHFQKMYALYQLLTSYPDREDAFYQATQVQFQKLHAQLDSTWKALDTLYAQSFANALIQRARPYFPEPTADRQQYNRAIRDHFFDYCTFDDPRLIHSTLYANKIGEYLNLWFNNRLEQEEQDRLFKQGIDALLQHTSKRNAQVFAYSAHHLQQLFKQIGNDELVFYIDNQWLVSSCEADELEKEKVQQRIEAYKQMQVGNLAPDFKASDLNGKTLQLYALKAPLKVLVFWASWCEHCQQEIPQLLPIYEQFKKQGIEFVAVSLDKDKAAWSQFVKEKQLNWLNISELKGFDSPIANAYYIFKTPSYIVLDQENKIVNKPRNLVELQDAIRNAVK